MDNKNELVMNSCPFCGAHAMLSTTYGREGEQSFAVTCSNLGTCRAVGNYFPVRYAETRDEQRDAEGRVVASNPDPQPAMGRAITWWNRRP